jgi:hypothetical protein
VNRYTGLGIAFVLHDHGYQQTWFDQFVINYRLPDTNVRASLDPYKGSVTFWHSTKAEERHLFGPEQSPEKVAKWLQSANAKGLYRCVDCPEERQTI